MPTATTIKGGPSGACRFASTKVPYDPGPDRQRPEAGAGDSEDDLAWPTIAPGIAYCVVTGVPAESDSLSVRSLATSGAYRGKARFAGRVGVGVAVSAG